MYRYIDINVSERDNIYISRPGKYDLQTAVLCLRAPVSTCQRSREVDERGQRPQAHLQRGPCHLHQVLYYTSVVVTAYKRRVLRHICSWMNLFQTTEGLTFSAVACSPSLRPHLLLSSHPGVKPPTSAPLLPPRSPFPSPHQSSQPLWLYFQW